MYSSRGMIKAKLPDPFSNKLFSWSKYIVGVSMCMANKFFFLYGIEGRWLQKKKEREREKLRYDEFWFTEHLLFLCLNKPCLQMNCKYLAHLFTLNKLWLRLRLDPTFSFHCTLATAKRPKVNVPEYLLSSLFVCVLFCFVLSALFAYSFWYCCWFALFYFAFKKEWNHLFCSIQFICWERLHCSCMAYKELSYLVPWNQKEHSEAVQIMSKA